MASAASTIPAAFPTLPVPGDEVFHFRLGRELGRGAFARVFLAEQADLANRRVVLKCSSIEAAEPQTLAQLQHTNIVPIYSVHEDRDAGLRAVCMPYFGGASLSQVLHMLWSKTERPVRGEELALALEAVQNSLEAGEGRPDGERVPPAPPPAADKGGAPPAANGATPLDMLRGLSYARAAAWLVAR